MEDWPAFRRSFDDLTSLIVDAGSRTDRTPPATITLLSGDIHFSYHAQIHFPASDGIRAQVHQLVNSPIRNALRPAEKIGMRVAMSTPVALIGQALRRSAGLRRTPARWRIDHGPVWDNCIGELTLQGRDARVLVEHAEPDEDGQPTLEVAFEVDLVAPAQPAVSRPRAWGNAVAGRTRVIVDRIAIARGPRHERAVEQPSNTS
jgi:hypothetical protein